MNYLMCIIKFIIKGLIFKLHSVRNEVTEVQEQDLLRGSVFMSDTFRSHIVIFRKKSRTSGYNSIS